MAKAIAISLDSPFRLALQSLRNSVKAVIDFMYGTQERAHFTYLFALGMAIAGGLLHMSGAGMACSHDTLAGIL